jgi:predicted Zn finger-like uncharacterized protein
MPVLATCPSCKRRIRVPQKLLTAGREVRCPMCHVVLYAARGATPGVDDCSSAPANSTLPCPHCRRLLYYDARLAGQTVACQHCSGTLTMLLPIQGVPPAIALTEEAFRSSTPPASESRASTEEPTEGGIIPSELPQRPRESGNARWADLEQLAALEKGSPPTDNLTECLDCHGQVSRRASQCPHCGCPLLESANSPSGMQPTTGAPPPGKGVQGICGAFPVPQWPGAVPPDQPDSSNLAPFSKTGGIILTVLGVFAGGLAFARVNSLTGQLCTWSPPYSEYEIATFVITGCSVLFLMCGLIGLAKGR